MNNANKKEVSNNNQPNYGYYRKITGDGYYTKKESELTPGEFRASLYTTQDRYGSGVMNINPQYLENKQNISEEDILLKPKHPKSKKRAPERNALLEPKELKKIEEEDSQLGSSSIINQNSDVAERAWLEKEYSDKHNFRDSEFAASYVPKKNNEGDLRDSEYRKLNINKLEKNPYGFTESEIKIEVGSKSEEKTNKSEEKTNEEKKGGLGFGQKIINFLGCFGSNKGRER